MGSNRTRAYRNGAATVVVALLLAGVLAATASAAEQDLDLVNTGGQITLPGSEPLEIQAGQAGFELTWDDVTGDVAGTSLSNPVFTQLQVTDPIPLTVDISSQIVPVGGGDNVTGSLDPTTGEAELESEIEIPIELSVPGVFVGRCTLGPTTVFYDTFDPDGEAWDPLPVDLTSAGASMTLQGEFELEALVPDDCEIVTDPPPLDAAALAGLINGRLGLPASGSVVLPLEIGELQPPLTTTTTTLPPSPVAPAAVPAPVTTAAPRFTG